VLGLLTAGEFKLTVVDADVGPSLLEGHVASALDKIKTHSKRVCKATENWPQAACSICSSTIKYVRAL
jgi:hypothetical protein